MEEKNNNALNYILFIFLMISMILFFIYMTKLVNDSIYAASFECEEFNEKYCNPEYHRCCYSASSMPRGVRADANTQSNGFISCSTPGEYDKKWP